MKVITLNGYGISSTDVNIVTDKIISFKEISYNGNIGTEILLSTGQSVRVGETVHKVRMLVVES